MFTGIVEEKNSVRAEIFCGLSGQVRLRRYLARIK